MESKKYIRTDLAQEAKEVCDIENRRGITYKEKTVRGFKVMDMSITTDEGCTIIGKPKGRYITLECGKPWLMEEDRLKEASLVISEYINELCEKKENMTVLVIGLGNRDITPDALGPLALDSLIVTRHIKDYDGRLFDSLGKESIAAIAPGVVGQTGIETLELIKGAVERVNPDLVIAIDALASRSVDRLGTTVQLSDTGISPGSGIGNRRKEITEESLGVPVISVGIPTVVDSSTLVYDALDKAGIQTIDDSLRQVLENGKSFFVSLKESDVAIKDSAKMLSYALNHAFCRP